MVFGGDKGPLDWIRLRVGAGFLAGGGGGGRPS